MNRLASHTGKLKAHYDVIVIGSGYGGGVAASRLARAGRKVCVLERGREFLPGDFPDRFPDLRRELQMSGAKTQMGSQTGLFDFRMGKDIHVLLGCGLGGGSLINAGVALRPDERVFRGPSWPEELTEEGRLDQVFARAESWLAPAKCPGLKDLAKYKALVKGSRSVKAGPVATSVAISFEARVNNAGIAQKACTYCGDCFGGCNVGAKNTVAMTYLPDAVSHGAEIYTEITVDHIQKTDGEWQVTYKNTNSEDAANQTMAAPIVILAAGSLGSTEILLRSEEQGLELSDRLGKGFSANGDTIAFGFDTAVKVNGVGVGHPPKVETDPVGPTVACQIEIENLDDLQQEMIIQDGTLPSAVAPLLPVLFIPGGRLIGAAKALLQGVYKGALANTQTFFIVSHDSASGTMCLEDGRLAIHWPNVNEEPVHSRIDAALTKIIGETGGTYVKNPLSETITGAKPATAHPLGGCAMANDRSSGVVNHKCQVFDGHSAQPSNAVHQGLYVCDGSIMPGSLGVNPLLTITALTERAMIYLAETYGWTFSDRPALAPTETE